jgi:parallel beta-helix repeat protein
VVSGNGINNGNQDAAGINLESNDQFNIIAGNEIGTNAAGDAMLGNSLHGIFLGNGSSNNTIGGTTVNDRNVISGNAKFPVADFATQGGVGVYIYGANTSGNVVQGNYIGTNAAGSDPLTNSVIGVLISQSSRNTVQGNLISGNRLVGLEIAGGTASGIAGGTASGNLVQGNLIGTNAGGTTAIPNGLDGVFINDAPNNTIGGTAAGAGNLISGNGSVGIQLFGPLTVDNVIQGNALGLNSAGRPTLRNPAGGIFVNTGPLNNTIGGTAPGQANRGQIIPLYTVSRPQQSTPGSTAQAATAAGRRFRIRGRARTSLRAHSTVH